MNLIIIPIKKHSQRLKNKNFLPLDGKPLFEFSLDYQLKEKRPGDIVILFCKDCLIESPGALTIIQQLPNMYQDLAQQFLSLDYGSLFLLQPTSPIRPPGMLQALESCLNQGNDSCAIVCPLKVKLCRLEPGEGKPGADNQGNGNQGEIFGGNVEPLNYTWHEPYQDLAQTWKETGQGYGVRKAALERCGKVLGGKVGAVIVPPDWFALHDIDTQEDFELYSQCWKDAEKRLIIATGRSNDNA